MIQIAEKPKTKCVVLTDRWVREYRRETDDREIVRDKRLPGLFVMVGARTKTYYVQFDYRDSLDRRKTCRKKLGRADKITIAQARAAASAIIAEGMPEPGTGSKAVTLRQAWDEYRVYLEREERSPRTIQGGDDIVGRLLRDWQDMPLRKLAENPGTVEDRYDELLKVGTASAKNAMACLRAVFNKAARRHPELRGLENPVSTFRLKTPPARNDKAMPPEALSDWYEQLRSLPNPLRQEMHLFALLSGSRMGALVEARWEHLNMKRRALHVPKPKGGSARAYDIPLSRRMLWCLARARRAGRMIHEERAQEWIFPAADPRCEHVTIWQEKWFPDFASGHALRHTYRSLAHAAGANPYDADMLMNHKVPGMAGTYISPAACWGHLLEVQEKVSNFIMEHCK